MGDRADTLISPDQQQKRIAGLAGGRGIEVEMLPPELDVSGGTTSRPILDEAIARVERGEAAGIIVAQLDRLSRMDIVEALHTIRRIEAAGGQVIAVAENFDATTPEGKLGRNVFLAMGEMQLDRYKAQFKSAKIQAVERGIWPNSTLPRGYRRAADRTLVPDPETAPAVRRAFEARAHGAPWSQVADILSCGPSGAARIVRNRAYLGEVRLMVDGRPVVKVGAHEPLVDRALWDAAQAKGARRPRSQRPPALLGGIIRCAHCQGTMTRSDRGYRCLSRKSRGRCTSPAWISIDVVEPYVEAIVLEHLEALRVEAVNVDSELHRLHRAVDQAEGELADFQEATSASGVGAEHFAKGLRMRVAAVEAERAELARARGAADLGVIAEALDVWHSLDVGSRAQVLRSAIGVVWVRRGKGTEAERVRVIAAGFEPADLSRSGYGRNVPMVPVDWENLDGVIAPAK